MAYPRPSGQHPFENGATPLEYAARPRRSARRRASLLIAITLLLSAATLSGCAAYQRLRPVPPPPAVRAVAPIARPPEPRDWDGPEPMHEYFTERFVAGDGFGGMRLANPIGSISHHQTLRIDGHTYGVDSIELISLDPNTPRPRLQPDPQASNRGPTTRPFAYTRPFYVSKDHLHRSDRRPLRPAELAALARVGNDARADFNPATDPPFVLGPIRATSQCLACHDGPVGRVLGAFSYTLWNAR